MAFHASFPSPGVRKTTVRLKRMEKKTRGVAKGVYVCMYACMCMCMHMGTINLFRNATRNRTGTESKKRKMWK